jgi:hypothetical protein
MAGDELNHFEQKFVTLSARRYRSWFYRWGHLLGWLAVPIPILMVVPGVQPYSRWLAWAGALLFFEWYHVATTRVIGKLQDRADSGS